MAAVLAERRLPFFALVEVRRLGELADVAVLDVEPEVPQYPREAVLRVERVAVIFPHADDSAPCVLSLRDSFPRIGHMQVPDEGTPWPVLCLYDRPYEETRREWTAARFLRRLHQWLSLAARGRLHQPGQSLEPFLPPAAPQVLLPVRLQDEKDMSAVELRGFRGDAGNVFVITYADDVQEGSGAGLAVVLLAADPQVHGALRHVPKTIGSLHRLLGEVGLDLTASLRPQVRGWVDAGRANDLLLILVAIPLLRTEGGTVERQEFLAFLTPKIGELGVGLGMYLLEHRSYLPAIPAQNLAAEDVPIGNCRPVMGFSRDFAAALNGRETDRTAITCVGVGALGSQVVQNLARAGYGDWVLVDDDALLPHNLARHALSAGFLSVNKARALSHVLNQLFEDEDIAQPVVGNVLERTSEIEDAVRNGAVILDMTASVPAARALTLDYEGNGRRVSAFLNPRGSDLVLLVEDTSRSVRLDDLEMQYYRAVLRNDELHDHFNVQGQRIAYGRSCRDVSSQLPQASVAALAGICAAALPKVLASGDAAVRVWSTVDDNSVNAAKPEVAPVHEYRAAGWTIRSDEEVERKLQRMRSQKLPNETGGVLVGHHDLHRRILYVVDALPSPPDSKEWPVAYIRGSQGLRGQLDEIAARTGNMIEYVGEWHSHPRGVAAVLSSDDYRVALWITEEMDSEELPGFMAIVDDNGPAWYVAEVVGRGPLRVEMVGAEYVRTGAAATDE